VLAIILIAIGVLNVLIFAALVAPPVRRSRRSGMRQRADL
jgi:hypothetical protein